MKIISKNKKDIRLTVVIENIHELVTELKENLDQLGLQPVYNLKKLFSFYKTAMFADTSWVRLYRIFWKFIITLGLIFTSSIIVCILFKKPETIPVVIIFSTILLTIDYLITEILFGRKMAKKIAFNEFKLINNDVQYENQIYKKAMLFGLGLYLIILFGVILLVEIV